MRPVDKGEKPTLSLHVYNEAIGELESRLGRFCSYCERKTSAGLAVEHVSPKSKDKTGEVEWDNFLLACVTCNSIKKDKDGGGEHFLRPDLDNTLLAIQYKRGLVSVSEDLTSGLAEKASALVGLVGLDRHPGQIGSRKPSRRDLRWQDREEAWKLADSFRGILRGTDNSEVREAIVNSAKIMGFFSVWMTVFESDVDMKRRFVEAFKGTSRDCFDENWNLKPRRGGRI